MTPQFCSYPKIQPEHVHNKWYIMQFITYIQLCEHASESINIKYFLIIVTHLILTKQFKKEPNVFD